MGKAGACLETEAIVRDATRFTVAKAMGVLSVCSEVLPQQQAGKLDTDSTGHGHTGSHRALTSQLGPRRYRHCTVPRRRLDPGTGHDRGPFTLQKQASARLTPTS